MLYVISILFHSNRRIPTSIDGIQNFYNTMLSGCLTSLPPAPYSQKHTNDSHCNRDLNYHFDLLVTKKKSFPPRCNRRRCAYFFSADQHIISFDGRIIFVARRHGYIFCFLRRKTKLGTRRRSFMRHARIYNLSH